MRVFAVTITLGNRRFTLPITGASYGEVLEKAWRVYPNAEAVSTPLYVTLGVEWPTDPTRPAVCSHVEVRGR